MLQPGDTQKMIFESNIVGTFLMSLENREKWGHDINVEGE